MLLLPLKWVHFKVFLRIISSTLCIILLDSRCNNYVDSNVTLQQPYKGWTNTRIMEQLESGYRFDLFFHFDWPLHVLIWLVPFLHLYIGFKMYSFYRLPAPKNTPEVVYSLMLDCWNSNAAVCCVWFLTCYNRKYLPCVRCVLGLRLWMHLACLLHYKSFNCYY